MFIYDQTQITRNFVLINPVFCIKKIVFKKFGLTYSRAQFQALDLNLLLYKLTLQSHIGGICWHFFDLWEKGWI